MLVVAIVRFKMDVYLFFIMVLSVATINVRSMKSSLRGEAVLSFLGSQNFDVFMLQECGFPFKENYSDMEKKWKYGPSFWSGSDENKSDGVAILIKNRNLVVKGSTVVKSGRLLKVDICYMGKDCVFVNVYASPNVHERTELFNDLRGVLVRNKTVVLAGDFNCVLRKEEKAPIKDGFKLDKSSLVLNEIVKDFKLIDSFRKHKPDEKGFTWVRDNGTQSSRIDFVFVSKGVKCIDCTVSPVFFSDHLVLNVKINLVACVTLGKGVWKLNISLLEDKAIEALFQVRYEEWGSLKGCFETEGQWWEEVKKRIKEFFIMVGKRKAGKEKREIGGLSKRLNRYYRLREKGFDFNEEINQVKKELKDIFERKCKKIILQSRVKVLEKNETCSRFFYKKVVEGSKTMGGLKKDGVVVSTTEEMLGVAEGFYKELYGEREVEKDKMEELGRALEGGVVNGKHLEEDLTLEEVGKAMKSFKRGKVPGSDGLPLEFYLKFWDIIAKDILLVFKEFGKQEILPESFRQGIITLIFKKNDKQDLKNWRPISLLNVDFKIFSKILTLWMKNVLEEVIDPDQTCAVPGRRITDSLVMIRDTICYARDRNMRICLLNLDLEKAYDRISHQFMFHILLKMGFPERFLAWVGLLYKGIESRILINGVLSKTVGINCGVRQGCPLSPLLFICCMEPLAQVLRKEKSITGFRIPGSGGMEVKCALYMDDVNVVCVDEPSVSKVLSITEQFCKASGSSLNKDKSEIMFYGKWDTAVGKDLNVKRDCIKILGVNFGSVGDGTKNWEEVGVKVKKKLGYWKLRNLTLEGKVLIVKAVILPVLLYTSMIFPPAKQTVCVLRRELFQFFWGSKWERLRREIVGKGKLKGGKGLPDIFMFLMIKYVCLHFDMCVNGVCKGAFFVRFFLGSYLRSLKIMNISLTVPTAFEIPYHYAIIKRFLKDRDMEKCGKDVFLNKKKLSVFVQEREQICPVKGAIVADPKGVWRNVAHPGLVNRHRDLSWLVAHDILPVRAMLNARNLSRTSRCPREGCGVEETCLHLFRECHFATDLWREVVGFTDLFLDSNILDDMMVLYGISKKVFPKELWFKIWVVITCVKEALWKVRNLLVLQNKLLTVIETKQLALSIVKDYVLRDVSAGDLEKVKMEWHLEQWEDGMDWVTGLVDGSGCGFMGSG